MTWSTVLTPSTPVAAGVLLTARSTGRSLFLLRSDDGYWGTPGGHVERGETPYVAMLRELEEETGWAGQIEDLRFCKPTHRGYRLYFGSVEKEFTPVLNEEHTKYVWASLWGRKRTLPEPLHPGLKDELLIVYAIW